MPLLLLVQTRLFLLAQTRLLLLVQARLLSSLKGDCSYSRQVNACRSQMPAARGCTLPYLLTQMRLPAFAM